MNYEHYTVKLKLLGPVHIGDGSKIGKYEYVCDGDKLYVFDAVVLFDKIRDRGLIFQYEENNQPLTDFFKQYGIDDYKNWEKTYILNGIDDNVAIDSYIKDAYGCPYIPGSSLKGALRTVLLKYSIDQNFEEYNSIRNTVQKYDGELKYKYKNVAGNAEMKAFHFQRTDALDVKSASNDIFRGLLISDSKPLSVDDLIVCRKIDIHTNGLPKPLNLVRECLKPGTEVEFNISVDRDVFIYSVDEIKKAISQTFKNYIKYLKEFEIPVSNDYTDDNIIVIGGGAGYWSKCVMYSLFDDDEALKNTKELLNSQFYKHKHCFDSQVSPRTRKCTKYNGKLYDFGTCQIDFIEN